MNEEFAVDEKKLKLDQLKQTVVNFIVPLVALLLSLGVGLLILLPSYRNKDALNLEINTTRNLEQTLQSKKENLNRLIDFKSVVDENSDLVNKVLVSEQQVPALLTQIDKIARDTGLDVNKLNYSIGSTATGESAAAITYDYVTVNLGITGSFNQVLEFLKAVENAARLIDVNNIRYSFSDTENGPAISATAVLISPFLFVSSSAVTDEPVDLNISDQKFLTLINDIKALRYYDPTLINLNVPVIEAPVEDEEAVEEEPAPVEPTLELPSTEPETPSIFGN